MPTEKACFLSHVKVWVRVSLQQEPALVLEDDVLLSDRLPVFLKACERLAETEHISLETRLRKKIFSRPKPLIEDISMARLYQDRTGAAAYVLWPQGAKRLLARLESKGAALADAFISTAYSLRSLQVVPALAIQSDVAAFYGVANSLETHSYIQAQGNRSGHEAHGRQMWVYKGRRIWGQLRLGLRVLTHLFRARRRHVLPDPKGFTFTEEKHEKTPGYFA